MHTDFDKFEQTSIKIYVIGETDFQAADHNDKLQWRKDRDSIPEYTAFLITLGEKGKNSH